MRILDWRTQAVWFDRPEDELHVVSSRFHYALAVWPRVVTRDVGQRGPTVVARAVAAGAGREQPAPLARRGRWQQLAFPFSHPRRVFGTAALAVYRDAIPERVRAAIEPFPEFHGALLEFASGGPACVDLLVSNPALAALLVTAWLDRDVSYSGLAGGGTGHRRLRRTSA